MAQRRRAFTWMRALVSLTLAFLAFGMVSCATPMPVAERSVGFTANSGLWSITLAFDPEIEVYRVSGRDAYNVTFDDVLAPYRRKRPFFYEGSSRYGWYGEKHRKEAQISQRLLKVAVEHAYYDFPDAHALDDFLSAYCSLEARGWTVLTEDGILVEVHNFNRDWEERHAIHIDAYRLLIKGQPPTESFLRPYVHGEFAWLNAASNIRSLFGPPYQADAPQQAK